MPLTPDDAGIDRPITLSQPRPHDTGKQATRAEPITRADHQGASAWAFPDIRAR
jgi:hypothetical protein